MIFIYDVLLNFQEYAFEFHDWNKNDKVTNVRRIPIFKISEKRLQELKNNDVEIEESFLARIAYTTEIYNKNNQVEKKKYAFAVSDGYTVLALNIDDNLISKSFLTISEEIEILDGIVKQLKDDVLLDYKIIKEHSFEKFKTREDIKNQAYFKAKLSNLEDYKLEYVYLEIFDKNKNDKKKIVEDLLNLESFKKTQKLIELLKIIKQKK